MFNQHIVLHSISTKSNSFTTSFFSLLFAGIVSNATAQAPVAKILHEGVLQFTTSPKGKVANLSFYVSDSNGSLIFDYQGEKGLTTASTQKIFTAATALELLGSDYQYTTTLNYNGNLENGTLKGNLIISGNGDPTLGSERYEQTKAELILEKFKTAIWEKGIRKIEGNLIIDDSAYDFQTTPGGWPWNDIGNYYGAGVFGINWRENKFSLQAIGSNIQSYSHLATNLSWINELTEGGTSDQSIIYTAPFSGIAHINGQLPADKQMNVSGANPNPPLQLGIELKNYLAKSNIEISGKVITSSEERIKGKKITSLENPTKLLEIKSPKLHEISYWFLQKSINLYGESFIKILAKEKTPIATFSSGIGLMKKHWISKGIPEEMINFADGSGLSPQNYVSAKAQTKALLYTLKQPWFDTFFRGFPKQKNGMYMKSGTMKNTKSFAGIHTSASGKTYVFSIILNNYQDKNMSETLYQLLKPLEK